MPSKRFSFRVFGETVIVAPAADVGVEEGPHRLPPIEAAWAIESMPPSVPVVDATIRADLSRALESIAGSSGRSSAMTLAELRAAVAEALRAGRLVAFRTSRMVRVQREMHVEPLGPESTTDEVLDVYVIAAEVKLIGDTRLIEHPVRILDPDTGEVIVETMTDEKGVVRAEVPKKKTYRIEIVDLDPEWHPPPFEDDPPVGLVHFRLVDDAGLPLAQREVKAKLAGEEMLFVTDDEGEVSAASHVGHYQLQMGDQTFDGHTLLAKDADDDDRIYEFVVHEETKDDGATDDPDRLERYDDSIDDVEDDALAEDEDSFA